jgi:hypothetical protein
MNILKNVFSVISLVAATLGAAAFFSTISEASSAPQQAAIGAMVMAGVIPFYVIARSFEMLSGGKE